MTTSEINGDPAAMTAFSQQLTAPAMPPSLARLGTPPNLAGLFEGIAMSLLDKAATAAAAAYLTQVTEELLTYAQKVAAAAATYTAADVASAAKLVSSAADLAQQGLGLVQKLSGSTSHQSPAPSTVHPPAADPGPQHAG